MLRCLSGPCFNGVCSCCSSVYCDRGWEYWSGSICCIGNVAIFAACIRDVVVKDGVCVGAEQPASSPPSIATTAAPSRVGELEAQIARLQHEMGNVTARLEASTADNTRLERQVELLSSEKTALTAEVARVRDEHQAATSRVQSLGNDNRDLTAEVQRLSKQLDVVNDEKRELSRRVGELSATVQQLRVDVEAERTAGEQVSAFFAMCCTT